MIRRPPRSTLSSSSAASDVYKRQSLEHVDAWRGLETIEHMLVELPVVLGDQVRSRPKRPCHVHQDLTLNPPSKIKFITFQNYYCGSIGLEVQYAGEHDWHTVLNDHSLMLDCHLENDAQQWHTIDSNQLGCGSEVRAVRFILRQPSPLWKSFGLAEIKCWWNSEEDRRQDDGSASAECAADVPVLSKRVSGLLQGFVESLTVFRAGAKPPMGLPWSKS
eukprot:TRINITY_DN19060_c0_g1_i4.p1 TRINITY_DN19060_c0_g1~~TRINITY_DN19060_c0_g1_i4.p1  ORF type:complete len:219 (-),score=42.12 TRINITY_DN19060_c0_g1_i4:289-945(-)